MQSPLMISSTGSAPGARQGPGVTERAGEIPVRITLTWDFGPGAPARWLRMNKNRYATRLPVPRRAAHGASSKFRRLARAKSGNSGVEPAVIRHDGWHPKRKPALRWVKKRLEGKSRTVPFSHVES